MKSWRKFPYIKIPLGFLILALAYQVFRFEPSVMKFNALGVGAELESSSKDPSRRGVRGLPVEPRVVPNTDVPIRGVGNPEVVQNVNDSKPEVVQKENGSKPEALKE